MACAAASAIKNIGKTSPGFTFTVSGMTGTEQTINGEAAVEPTVSDITHPGNECIYNHARPLNKETQAASERERRVSSSSSESAESTTQRKRPRKNKGKKSKMERLSGTVVAANTSPEVDDDTPSSQGSCSECQTDLTDSDAEVCQNCFGLRKQKISVDSEFCAFPFGFIKSKYLPAWLHEPEYMIWHPKPRSNSTEREQQLNQEPIADEIHRNTDSLFSTSSNFTNYRGLLNLALILLVLSNARLCIENLIKYGVLIEPLQTAKSCISNLNNWPNVQILIYQGVHTLVAFLIEYYLLSKGRISEKLGFLLNATNSLFQLTFPAYVVLNEHPNPVFSALTLALVTILFLKLISYVHVNYWCRSHKHDLLHHRRRQSSSGDQNGEISGFGSPPREPIVKYPENINLKDIAYFVVAPTLCYELNFPRSARIRKRFLIKRVVEMVFLFMVIIGLVQQWIVPTISNSIKPLSELDLFKCVERLLKLAVPNHFIWLMCFYAFFHSMLNVMAELLMFGDRDFYQDWWNAETIAEFWQNWNIPVHRWAIRHMYKPLRRRAYSRLTGSIIVFIVSAFFHEYLVSVPLKMFKCWAFLGMLSQVPLAVVTGKYFDGKWGNIVVWLSLILGQPVAILAYVHDYYLVEVLSQPVVNATVNAALHTEL